MTLTWRPLHSPCAVIAFCAFGTVEGRSSARNQEWSREVGGSYDIQLMYLAGMCHSRVRTRLAIHLMEAPGRVKGDHPRTFAHIPSHVPGATSRTAMHSIGIRYHGFGVSSGCNGLMWCHQTIAAVREPCATADAVDATYAN